MVISSRYYVHKPHNSRNEKQFRTKSVLFFPNNNYLLYLKNKRKKKTFLNAIQDHLEFLHPLNNCVYRTVYTYLPALLCTLYTLQAEKHPYKLAKHTTYIL